MSETASGTAQKSQESGIQSVPGTQGTTQAHPPWTVREEGFTFHRLCTVRDSRGERVVDGFQHVDLARLIAAAPEMLAALKAEHAKAGFCAEPAICDLAKVIAKAEGR